MFQILFSISIALLSFSCHEIQTPPLTVDQTVAIDKITLRDVPDGAPGVACGIIMDGKIVYTKIGGYANLEDSVLIDENSRFNIASNAKQYVAAMALELIDKGDLSLDDDIRKFYPDVYKGIDQPITISHLLTHSSGIRDVYDLWNLKGLTWWEHTFSNKDAIELISSQQDLNFVPGTDYMYSNSNYILLAEIIALVEGESFAEVSDAFFKKVGMNDTSFEVDYRNIKGPIANPYFNFNTWTGYEWKWNAVGDGNLFSTLKDQLKWEQIIQGYGGNALNERIIKLSQQPVKSSEITSYGYGIEFSDYRGYQQLFHHGGTGAWKATTTRFPTESVSIVTLSNSGKTDVAGQNLLIADILFSLDSDEKPYLIEPEEVGAFVSEEEILGIYLTESSYAFKYIRKDGELYLRRSGRNDILLQRESDNVFNEVNDPAFKQEFVKDEDGVLTVTAYYNTHGPFSLSKVEEDWEGFNFKSLEGSYLNGETDVRMNIEHKDESNYNVKIGEYETKGLLVNTEKMLVDGYNIIFGKMDDKIVVYLNGDRAKNIRFQ